MNDTNAEKIINLIDEINDNFSILGELLVQMCTSAYVIQHDKVIFNGEEVTYKELNDMSIKNSIIRSAKGLQERGLFNKEEL